MLNSCAQTPSSSRYTDRQALSDGRSKVQFRAVRGSMRLMSLRKHLPKSDRSLLASARLLSATITEHSESLLKTEYLLYSNAGVLPGIAGQWTGGCWNAETSDFTMVPRAALRCFSLFPPYFLAFLIKFPRQLQTPLEATRRVARPLQDCHRQP